MFSTVEQFSNLSRHNVEGMEGLLANFSAVLKVPARPLTLALALGLALGLALTLTLTLTRCDDDAVCEDRSPGSYQCTCIPPKAGDVFL